MSRFRWGIRSKLRLRPAHPDLRRVLDRFITITPVDCTVLEVARSVARQRKLVASGASLTMNSRHIPDGCGVVHAADVAPLVGGRVSWAWPQYYDTAEAMREAAILEGVGLRWGGIWDRTLLELNGTIEDEVAAYVARRRDAGKKAFLDGPHNELPVQSYP